MVPVTPALLTFAHLSLPWNEPVRVAMRLLKFIFLLFKATNKKGQETFYTASKFVIATGERPRYLGVQGDKEYCITR